MLLFFKDLVTDELFLVECQASDTLDNLKYQFMMHQNLSFSPSDLIVDFFYQNEEMRLNHTEMDITFPSGTIEGYQLQEKDTVLFMYQLGA